MNSIRRTATRASLTRAVSTATSAAPKTQSIAFALRSVNAVRCFSVAAPRAFSNSIARLEYEQREQRAPEARRQPASEHCVFVQNYPFQITRDELTEAFAKFGEVVHVHTPIKKTFCFVYYNTAEEAKAAADNVDGTFWHGRRIVVKVSDAKGRRESPARDNNNSNDRYNNNVRRERKPRYDGPPTNTVFVGNLSFDATDAELNELFSVFKNVKDVRVAVDKHTGWPRGFAHAEFKTLEDAAAGREAVNGKELRGRTVIANFAPDRRVDDDAAQAAEQSKHQNSDWNA